jgi:hypothetical protein
MSDKYIVLYLCMLQLRRCLHHDCCAEVGLQCICWHDSGMASSGLSWTHQQTWSHTLLYVKCQIWTQLPICLHEQSWVFKRGTSFLPLDYTFWCSVSTPELLVVALRQALLLSQVIAFHHSFITHLLLITFLWEQNGTGWDDQFLLLTT